MKSNDESNEVKDTPCPTKDTWAVGIINEETAQVINSDGWSIAYVDYYPLLETARLISAAPELLNALESFVLLYKQGQLVIEGDNGNDPVVANALNAISKAKGE